MVEKNYVNLLKEIQRIKCDLIIFTTYSFDPFFFDHMLLRKLRDNNPNSEIIVLVDEEHINLENRTEKTGVEYFLIPIPSTFHPKLFIFCAKNGITTFIGSHNLTLTGFTYNLELDYKITNDEISEKCISYVKSILSQFLESNHKLFEKISKYIGKENQPVDSQLFFQFIQNLDKPMLSQTLEIIETEKMKCEEITIIAPFYSSVRQLVQELHKKTKAAKINLCVQLHNHNLDVNTIDDLPYINLMKTMPKSKRPLHCKLLLFHNKSNPFILIGSPNFTHAAMINASKNRGNYETAALMEITQDKFKDILSELKLSKVSKERIEETKRKELLKKSKKKEQIHLILAEYKSLQLVLHLMAFKPVSSLELNIKALTGEVYTHNSKFKIDNAQKKVSTDLFERPKSGSSIWLSSNNKRVSNIIPIIMPMEYELINFNKENFERISMMIGNSNNFGALLQTMLRIFPFESEILLDAHFPSNEGSKRHPISSNEPHYNPMKLLDLLEKCLRIRHKPKSDRKPSEKKEKKAKHSSVQIEGSGLIEKRTFRIIKKLSKAFEAKKIGYENSDVFHIFVLLSINICKNICSLFALDKKYDDLVSYSLGTFESMWKKHQVAGSTERLLAVLIYIEEQGFRINSTVMKEIIKGLGLRAKSVPELIQKVELKIQEINNHMKSMALNASEDKYDVYSARIADLLWTKNNNLLWKSLTDNRKLVENLATECFLIIHGKTSVSFTTLFGATIGKDMELSELKAFYGRYPELESYGGCPSFKVETEQRKKILNLILERLLENLCDSYSELNSGKPMHFILKRQLEHFVKKNVETLIFSISVKNQECLVNIGRLFLNIDPSCSDLIEFTF